MGFLCWKLKQKTSMSMGNDKISEKILFWLALIAFVWLAGGLVCAFLI
jgi:hypothetical protein